MIERIHNQKALIMVLPVILLVAFNAVIPIMTVVNYSVQETFGNNVFFWGETPSKYPNLNELKSSSYSILLIFAKNL